MVDNSAQIKEKIGNITFRISKALRTLRSFRLEDGINILSAQRRLLRYKHFINFETFSFAIDIMKTVLADATAIEEKRNREDHLEKLGKSSFDVFSWIK